MIKKTVAIIGGSQEQTYKKIGKKLGCDVLFHNGKTRNGGTKKEFRPLVQKADCVVILLGACGHITMEIVKDLCKENAVQLIFQQGRGASGALTMGMSALEQVA